MDDVCPNCGSRGWFGDTCIHCWWDPDQDHFQPYWMKKEEGRRGGMTFAEWEQAVATGWKHG